MKSVLVFVLAVCAVAFAYPKPAEVVTRDDDSREADAEFVRIPLTRNHPSSTFDQPRSFYDDPSTSFGVIELPAPLNPFQHPFFHASPWNNRPVSDDLPPNFITQLQELLIEMRKQLKTVVVHAHDDHGIEGEEDSVGTRIGEGDLPQNKTTSTTKVIDGHVVTVNETTYTSGDDNMGSVWRIKMVEVKPSESPKDEAEPEAEEESSSEFPETDNETTNNNSEDHEETNEIQMNPDEKVEKVQYEWSPEFDPSINEIEQPEDVSVEQFTPNKSEKYYDLSDDTKVNNFLSDQAESQGLVMMNPDAELIDTDANSYYRYDTEPQRVHRFR